MLSDRLTLAELVALKEQGVAGVARVVLFGAGLHREGEPPYSRDDITAILRNFQTLSTGATPPLPVTIALGHPSLLPPPLGASNEPAIGRVPAVWSERGGVLCASFADLPDLIARAVRQGLFFRVSAEIDPEPPFGLPGKGCCLTGVALLGRTRPQLKWTSHVTGLTPYTELPPPKLRRVFRACPVAGRPKTFRVYSEAVMDRKQLEGQLAGIGWSDALVKLASEAMTDDAQFAAFVNAALAEKAGAGGGEGGAAAASPDSRAGMIDAILAADPSQDRATLEAMSDADLATLYQQITGGYAERGTGSTTVTTLTPDQLAEAKTMFAELKRLGADVRQSAAVAKRERDALAAAAADRTRAEQAATAEAERTEARIFCERLAKDGKVKAADLDQGSQERPNWTLVDELLSHDNTRPARVYSEGGRQVTLTARDLFKRKLEARPKGLYGEALGGYRGDAATDQGADYFKALRDEAAARYAAKNAAPAISLETRLGMLPTRHQR